MKVLRVAVATTNGPSVIQRITPEAPELRSVICLNGTPSVLPISPAYDAFVRRPTGIVERDVGHAAFRVDVSAPIDEGDSWQLGLYLAHRLKQAGRLGEEDGPADGLLWVSGRVDMDLRIGPVSRLPEKAALSAAMFADEEKSLAIVPAGQAAALPETVTFLAAERVATVLAALDLPAGSGKRRQVRRSAVGSLLLALGLAGIGWLVWPDRQPLQGEASAPRAFAVDPMALALSVVERRPDPAGACEPDGWVVVPGGESRPGVCAIGFRVTNAAARPVRFWLYAALEGAFREYAARKRYTELVQGILSPGESGEAELRPPDWVRQPVMLRGLLVMSDTEEPQVDDAMTAIGLMAPEEIDALIDGLRRPGLAVRDVRHRIVPD